MEDVVVCGGGAAGLAAATWLGRYRRKALVLDAQNQRNRYVESSHGYLGLDGISPRKLLDSALEDLERYTTVELRQSLAETVRRDGGRLCRGFER